MTAQRAREDGRSSHCAQGMLPRDSIIFRNEYGHLWWEKKNYLQDIQGQLQFESVALLTATYRQLVHWLQVSTKQGNVCNNSNASHMLAYQYAPVYRKYSNSTYA